MVKRIKAGQSYFGFAADNAGKRHRVNKSSGKPRKLKPVVGLRFGRLEIIAELPREKGRRTVKLKCDCGGIIIRPMQDLAGKRYGTKSCGCLKAETTRNRSWKGCGDVSASVIYRAKEHARKRGIEFTITIQYISHLYEEQGKRCALSGIKLYMAGSIQKIKNRILHTASLDRIDSSRGYVFGNVHWVHKHINIMKNAMPVQEFLLMCALVSEHKAAAIAALDRSSPIPGLTTWMMDGRGRKKPKKAITDG